MVFHSGDALELFRINATGVAVSQGIMPPLPPRLDVVRPERLDKTGAVFSTGRDIASDYADVIVRRRVGAEAEIVYSENMGPRVRIHGSDLVTGP